MRRLGRTAVATALTISAVVAGASSASASTLFVNASTGKDANSCTSAAAPCATIKAAVEKSELLPDPIAIEIAAGTYKEAVNLASPSDDDVTLNGAGSGPGGTVIEGSSSSPTIGLASDGSVATLANLEVLNPSGDNESAIGGDAVTTLENVLVDAHGTATDAIDITGIGSLTIHGGGVTMESGSSGFALEVEQIPVDIESAAFTIANGSTASAIESVYGPTSLSNVQIDLGNTAASTGLTAAYAKPLSLSNVSVTDDDSSSTSPAITTQFSNATIDRLNVSGTWKGPVLTNQYGGANITDSRLLAGPASEAPTLIDLDFSGGTGVVLQRSVVQDSSTTSAPTIDALGANVTLDSSEVLGGHTGILLEQPFVKPRTVTVAGSTIDAGTLGSADPAPISGIELKASGTSSQAIARIEGSVVLEAQKALVSGTGATANIECSHSDVPNQVQTASATEGSIDCASGSNGDIDTTSAPASTFSAPITSYSPLPGSPLVDSVPAGAIALPAGLTPSGTDLNGNPRVVDGTGDCVALQDMGAIELQGHSAECPKPAPKTTVPPPVPTQPKLTGLTISPSAFFAAPSGATISKSSKAKKTYGATISYKDAVAASTTFTVLRKTQARTQGKSCRKPSKSNKHGKRCTLLVKVGSFAHSDVAGATKLHFSGRLKDKKLAKGSYLLRAQASNSAGKSTLVSTEFKIKG